MSGEYLLDTNIVIALFADEVGVKENLAKADEVFVSSIVPGELCFGAWKSSRPQANLARIEEFVANCVVLGCDSGTAWRYGEVKNALRVKGCPLPENDVWVAAVALQHHLTLVTRDGHFSEVNNLKVEAW